MTQQQQDDLQYTSRIVFNALHKTNSLQTAGGLRQHNYYTRTATLGHPLNKLTGLENIGLDGRWINCFRLSLRSVALNKHMLIIINKKSTGKIRVIELT